MTLSFVCKRRASFAHESRGHGAHRKHAATDALHVLRGFGAVNINVEITSAFNIHVESVDRKSMESNGPARKQRGRTGSTDSPLREPSLVRVAWIYINVEK